MMHISISPSVFLLFDYISFARNKSLLALKVYYYLYLSDYLLK